MIGPQSQPTGRMVWNVDITGYLMPVYRENEQPVMLFFRGDWILPIFSTEAKLLQAVEWMKPGADWKIKQIDEAGPFLESIWAYDNVRVGADPYIHAGNTRWLEIRSPAIPDSTGGLSPG